MSGRTVRINCYLPITLRIAGIPTDDQLAALGAALTRSVTARLAEAERVLAGGHPAASPGLFHLAADPAPGTTVTAAPPAVVPAGPDANEAAYRREHPDLAVFDKNKPAQENEDAIWAVVIPAFGSAAAAEAAFQALAPVVKLQADLKIDKTDPDALAANHRQFLVRMRLYFPDWATMLAHFSPAGIVEVSDGEVDVWLHISAATRLRRVIQVMKKMKNRNRKLPKIGEGFSLRGFHTGPFQNALFMTHALGYAVDIAAHTNPKIFTPPATGDPGRHDPVQVASSVGSPAMHIPMAGRLDDAKVVQAMGTRTAANTDAAADDPDPAARDYFRRFELGFKAMQSGSAAFVNALGEANRTELLALRQRYFGILAAIKAEKRKGSNADRWQLNLLAEQRRRTLAEIPGLTREWLVAIDDDIERTTNAHRGIARLRSQAQLRSEIAKAGAALGKARAEAARTAAALKSARAATVQAEAATMRALRREGKLPPGPDRDKASDDRTALGKQWMALQKAQESASEADSRARAEVTDRAAELKLYEGMTEALPWLEQLRYLRRLLEKPDLGTPAGFREYEKVTVGDPARPAPEENPPLLQLLTVGYFNPTEGTFDLAFFEEMAHSGFWPGATWDAGHADPMHFELYEGRVSTQQPGKLP